MIYHKTTAGKVLSQHLSAKEEYFSEKDVCWRHPNTDVNGFSQEWVELLKLNFVAITAWKVSVFGVFWSVFSRIRTEYGKILRK